ncbi:uncharacterized protein LOC129106773 [Anoplopoma fimbria]|uniref:uncharacterized protein LOC129106773 n=1 Tax=Anoplopoma fimbria TaxID=229290 RepID=UPI0023EADD0E|nr:uncharacterized protein LOC129106773 [Anoplopoma fimbria]
MTEHKDTDEVTLICSVSSYGGCRHKVKWLLQGQDVDKDHKELKTSTSSCRASLMFLTSHYVYTSRYKTVKCEVTEGDKVKQFPFNIWPSGEKKGDAATTTTTTSPTTTLSTSPVKKTTSEEKTVTASEKYKNQTEQGWWWWSLISVSVGVAALLVITVAVIAWKRTKRNKTKRDDHVADPEDGVSYASVSFTKNTNSRAKGRIQHDDDEDEGDAVTYSTVKPPSSSAAASVDPSHLYATVNKPK